MSDEADKLTGDDLVRIVDDYVGLVDRAIEIVKGAPYWQYVSETSWADLTIENDTATLWWPRVDTDYEGCSAVDFLATFPVLNAK